MHGLHNINIRPIFTKRGNNNQTPYFLISYNPQYGRRETLWGGSDLGNTYF
jgi:hypothetical protein